MRGIVLKVIAGTALSLAAAHPAAAAITIESGSQISIGGFAQLNGPAGGTASQTTSIDFLTNGVSGPAAGTLNSYIGTGTFAGQICSSACGMINDITSLTVGSSVTPFFTLSDGVTFALNDITSIDRSISDILSFTGTGTFGGTLGGVDISATPANFFFSTQGGNLTTFSASALAPAVPEPATWALMLLGFGGMGISMRRNRRCVAIAQIA